jgi:NADH-quinone oxidoreductase subunit E
MRDEEYETTIGTGGWVLVGFSGIVTFAVLRGLMHYFLLPAVLFALAVALIVLLGLYSLAAKVNRDEEAAAAQRVRKIVPASGEVRLGTGEGAAVPAVKAVPVRPEELKARAGSSVVTPLVEVEPAPIIATPKPPVAQPAAPVVAEAAAPVAAVMAEPVMVAGAKPKAAAKPKAEAKPKAAAEPKPKAAKPKAEKSAKPVGLVRLKAPRKGKADDLKEIEGIGPALEKLVNGMGFFHFDQIAQWTEADVALVDAEMKTFKGRISRDKWVEQAKIIVSEGLEAFRERARSNEY